MVCQKRKKQKIEEKIRNKNRQYVSSTVELRGVSSCCIRTGFTARDKSNMQDPFLNHNSKMLEV
jgi:predicted transposase YbfD/YdcC